MQRLAVFSRMGRRMGVALALCAVLPVLLFAFVAIFESSGEVTRALDHRLAQASRAQAYGLRSRLGAAEAIVQTFTTEDVGGEGGELRTQILNSRAFKSVVLGDRNGLLTGGESALRPSTAQLSALTAGQTVLLMVRTEERYPAVFMARLARAGGVERLAYFELAPDWLWESEERPAGGDHIVVIDAHGAVLQGHVRVPADLAQMFSRSITSEGRTAQTHSLTWQAEGAAWRGALTEIPLNHERITAMPWAVVTYDSEPTPFSGDSAYWRVLPIALLLGLLLAALGAIRLTRRYLPPVLALTEALPALQSRQFTPLALGDAADEPRRLITVFNRSLARLEAQFYALETLGEIDKLLLGSAETERVLDAILTRVQAVTRSHSVGITLCDADAPGYARVFMTANESAGLPVKRVQLDEAMLETLTSATDGLTVTRCEEQRHSFLAPMQETGAQFFWVWPVISEGRVTGILAVGYREAPLADPQIARYCSQFAERLSMALSKSAHDERLYRQAHFDPLTALPNRLLFRDRLAQELASSTAGLSRGALLYVDLDHFKKVNDTVGHSAGDQLLIIIAQRLRSAVKDGDTVSRLGGDEFAVILRNVADPDAARAIGERIIESVQLPVNVAGQDHYVCASIGITLFPDDSAVIEELMRNADMAMYRAKALGRGRALFFDVNMTTKAATPTESGLHRALRRREFSLFYQPQFAVSDGSLQGMEALLRWQPPRESMRLPSDFVPAAEESGLIVDLGGWVLDAACAQLAIWRDRKLLPPRLALNVSAHQLRHAEFPKHVRRALDKYGLSPALLEIELTETAFADEFAGAGMAKLAALGVHLTLDDFGTGYSSLNYLRQHPISTVKIDRSFLEGLPTQPTSVTLVETIISMAHSLGKRVVAEGVESIEQLQFLRERRCDIAQGFYLARPLPEAALTALLESRAGMQNESIDVRAAG